MYVRIDCINSYDINEKNIVKERWETKTGQLHREYIIDKINNNKLNHLLQSEFQCGYFNNFLLSENDVRGISFVNNKFLSMESDAFHYLDFSYSNFITTTFDGYVFAENEFSFCIFYNCTFKNCIFNSTGFYFSQFQNCRFEKNNFYEKSNFENCFISDTKFLDTFFDSSNFIDCKFDSLTEIQIKQMPNIITKDIIKDNTTVDKTKKNNEIQSELWARTLSDLYLNIAMAYQAGNVSLKQREYLYLSKSSFTKYNVKGVEKLTQTLINIFTGYGLKPLRPAMLGISTILLFGIIFLCSNYSINDALQLSFGAYLNIGDINPLSNFGKWVFLIEGFLGVFSFGLFLSTLLNIWFSEK